MKYKSHLSLSRGFTLIELSLVVAILSILGSILLPRMELVMQKAYQSAAKSNLGAIRSALALYHSEQEGRFPYPTLANGFADAAGASLSSVLAPKYVEEFPITRLMDRAGNLNGIAGIDYDSQISIWKSASIVQDMFVWRGNPGPTPGVDRPFVYDPEQGLIYICNDNYDSTGNPFYQW